jgi:hypothetical protein
MQAFQKINETTVTTEFRNQEYVVRLEDEGCRVYVANASSRAYNGRFCPGRFFWTLEAAEAHYKGLKGIVWAFSDTAAAAA